MNNPTQPEDDSNWDDLARDFGLEPDHEVSEATPESEELPEPTEVEAPREEAPQEEPADDEPVPIAIIFDDEGEPHSADEEPPEETEQIPESAELFEPEPDGPVEPVHGATRVPRELEPEAQALFDTIFVPKEDGRILRFPSSPVAWPSDESITDGGSADQTFDADEPDESDEEEVTREEPVTGEAKSDDDGERKKRRRRRRKKREDGPGESDAELPSRPRPHADREVAAEEPDPIDRPDEDDEEVSVVPVGDWNLPTWDELIASLNRN